jgi:hypothetical protein
MKFDSPVWNTPLSLVGETFSPTGRASTERVAPLHLGSETKGCQLNCNGFLSDPRNLSPIGVH